MADTKISALSAGAALAGTETIPAVQSAATVKVTATQIKTFTSASPTLVTPVLGVASATSIAPLNFTDANTLEQYNSTTAQVFYLYNTRTDASNYERAAIRWTGNICYFQSQKAGTGGSRNIGLLSVSAIEFWTGNTQCWNINTPGHLVAQTDNFVDIGATNATRPRRLYLGTGLSVEATVTAGGTTGAQTINKTAGTVNFAAAASTLVVTNSTVTASSLVFCVIRTNDGTATIKNVVPSSGSFTITLTAAATAETSVGFFVVEPD